MLKADGVEEKDSLCTEKHTLLIRNHTNEKSMEWHCQVPEEKKIASLKFYTQLKYISKWMWKCF